VNQQHKEYASGGDDRSSLVLYCLVRRRDADGRARFLVVQKPGGWTFPPTKLRPGEDLYCALTRPLGQDLGLPAGSYFPEEELPMIPNDQDGPSYQGLPARWHLYPVDVSLTDEAAAVLRDPRPDAAWWRLDELLAKAHEPNVHAIAHFLRGQRPDLTTGARTRPSQEALACEWAARNRGGVRVARYSEIREALAAGARALKLRVADPYLPYQRQGLGFTWSFFTPRDKQDVHVHGLPAVEVYGVFEGRLQLWHKPMNERGALMWQTVTAGPGDWIEVAPLFCHFACWLDPDGFGSVFKAAGAGELAGVGRIGTAGKTLCEDCSVNSQCATHPRMDELVHQYSLPYEQRDYDRIRKLGEEQGPV